MTPRPRLRPSLAVAAFTSVVLLAGEGALPVIAARSTTGPSHSFRSQDARWNRAAADMPHFAHLHARVMPGIHSSAPARQQVSVQSSSQLSLPRSAFPGDFREASSNVVTAAAADDKILSQLHTRSYTDLGMAGGWFTYYTNDLPDGLFDIVYLGSYYRDVDTARAAYDDVANNFQFLGTTASCSFGEHCSQMTTRITFPDGVYHATVRAVQTSNALAEYSIAVPAADYPSMQTTVQEDLDTATRAFLGLFVQAAAPTAISTPTPTPIPPTATPTATPTTIPQPAVAIERIAVLYRAHGQWKTTRVVHPSDRVRIEAYYHATNTGSYIPAGDVHITGHGLTLYRGSMTAATTSDGSAYLYAVNRLQGKGLGGRISIAVTVTLGPATDNRSVQLSVKGAR